jgi:hypothetical protein
MSHSELEDQKHLNDGLDEDEDDEIVRALMQRPIDMERLRFSWLTCATERWRHDKVDSGLSPCFSVAFASSS